MHEITSSSSRPSFTERRRFNPLPDRLGAASLRAATPYINVNLTSPDGIAAGSQDDSCCIGVAESVTWGNPHAQFERGPEEAEPACHYA